MSIPERLQAVRERIAAAAERAGRDPSEVGLVAVTKSWPAHIAIEAFRAGAADLGENRAQELREKAIAISEPVRWHFIGHLQTNKARQVVGVAALIHSVDRFGLAEEIARRARQSRSTQEVLIEVNVSGEPTKHGVEPSRAAPLAQQVAELDGITVRGFMTMAPLAPDPEASRPFFSDLRELRDRVQKILPDAGELSMGMTRDFEVAIEEGATLVRVGEAVFGPRRPAAG